jgi:hypothetical protein
MSGLIISLRKRTSMEFQKGDIGFVISHDKWFDRLLAKCMNSKWSHCFLVINEKQTVETDWKKVHIDEISCHTDDLNKSLEIWRPLQMSTEEKCHIVTEGLKTLHTWYGYLQFPFLGLRILCKRKIPSLIKQGIVCNGVVIAGYKVSSYPAIKNMPIKGADTEELYIKIKNTGNFVRIYSRQSPKAPKEYLS